MADLDKLVEELGKLSVIEAAELVKQARRRMGRFRRRACRHCRCRRPRGAAAGDGAAEEEKTEFDVVLKDAGPKRIEVIKVIRQLTSLGLKEAKEMAETAGSKVHRTDGQRGCRRRQEKIGRSRCHRRTSIVQQSLLQIRRGGLFRQSLLINPITAIVDAVVIHIEV